MNLLIKDIDICLVYMSLIYTHTLHMFNKMAGVPKGVENFLKEGFGDTRHLSIGLRGFGMFEIKSIYIYISYTRFKIVLAARLYSHTSFRGSLEQHCGLNF